ncbi:MAG: S8 family serine peptidase [Melioribacteraceae bacterium]|nr:S8 family serine peptidase [Melioribacteraceae bacterium]MCF8356154.1 S8 family serine peptidase [Melioribacteraceae bacterium]MCF8395616.1 S8 family serine peptidase [Melioribacteraceae bacterium]MCF8420867.1 S8 family serine peptidase [Melioribacteraceae bacterium]
MKKFILVLLSLLFSLINITAQVDNIVQNGKSIYEKNKIIIKFGESILPDAEGNFAVTNQIAEAFEKFEITETKRKFNFSEKNIATSLNRVAEITLHKKVNIFKMCRYLSRLPGIEWAEPKYVHKKAVVTPNDPGYSEQWYLPKISAEQAWDIETGNAEIVIAIVDDGINLTHNDLANNLWVNSDEILDGTDTDGNGFVDDINGWDFGQDDNDPTPDAPNYHGTLVAGITSAETNNSIGIASIGYNSSLMPVKITDNNDLFVVDGFDGIVYAVDNGASIINCSWGNYDYSILGKEVVDFAIENDVLVVAAAGNDGYDEIFYPAAYDGVLSVGATSQTDEIWSATNYGTQVDLMAPGQDIYSTESGDGYATASGTSLASPMVAGLAALVKNHFDYNALQVAEQIRATTDDIYTVNPSLEYLLGSGRINAYSALTSTGAKSVRINNISYIDNGNGNGIIEIGEEFEIEIDFTNYLAPSTSLIVNLISSNPNVTVNTSVFNVGSIGTLESFDNSSNPFSISISESISPGTDVNLMVQYTADEYSDFEWISFVVSPEYATQDANNVALTISSDGALGYNDYPYWSEGIGFTYLDGLSLLYEGAFMYGVSSSIVMDAAHSTIFEPVVNDFTAQYPFTLSSPGDLADQQGRTIFNDGSASGSLGITTDLRTYSYVDAPDNNYIILKYILRNQTDADVNNLYAGLFLDWDMDLDDWDDDVVVYDMENNVGLVSDSDNQFTGGITATVQAAGLVSSEDYNFYAIQSDGGDGGISLDPFSTSNKFTALSNGLDKTTAGPNDISFVVSGGPFTIPANNSIAVAFALGAGNDIAAASQSILNARTKYADVLSSVDRLDEEVPSGFALKQNFPNPFNPSTKIEFQIPGNTSSVVNLTVFDLLGRKVRTLINKSMLPGNYIVTFDASGLASGIYFYKLQAGEFREIKKMILLR